jgi:flavin reductase (DIM6/NTAB) family NADH-FMN oxidoreductase RutF
MLLDVTEFYKLLVRPPVVISTISPHNIANAAPFSWNAPMATSPTPLFGFSSNVHHQTWRNIQANGDFVVNLVDASFGPLMERMERDLPYEVDEIAACGLWEAPANHVTAPRIREAFGWRECTMTDHIVLSGRNV